MQDGGDDIAMVSSKRQRIRTREAVADGCRLPLRRVRLTRPTAVPRVALYDPAPEADGLHRGGQGILALADGGQEAAQFGQRPGEGGSVPVR